MMNLRVVAALAVTAEAVRVATAGELPGKKKLVAFIGNQAKFQEQAKKAKSQIKDFHKAELARQAAMKAIDKERADLVKAAPHGKLSKAQEEMIAQKRQKAEDDASKPFAALGVATWDMKDPFKQPGAAATQLKGRLEKMGDLMKEENANMVAQTKSQRHAQREETKAMEIAHKMQKKKLIARKREVKANHEKVKEQVQTVIGRLKTDVMAQQRNLLEGKLKIEKRGMGGIIGKALNNAYERTSQVFTNTFKASHDAMEAKLTERAADQIRRIKVYKNGKASQGKGGTAFKKDCDKVLDGIHKVKDMQKSSRSDYEHALKKANKESQKISDDVENVMDEVEDLNKDMTKELNRNKAQADKTAKEIATLAEEAAPFQKREMRLVIAKMRLKRASVAKEKAVKEEKSLMDKKAKLNGVATERSAKLAKVAEKMAALKAKTKKAGKQDAAAKEADAKLTAQQEKLTKEQQEAAAGMAAQTKALEDKRKQWQDAEDKAKKEAQMVKNEYPKKEKAKEQEIATAVAKKNSLVAQISELKAKMQVAAVEEGEGAQAAGPAPKTKSNADQLKEKEKAKAEEEAKIAQLKQELETMKQNLEIAKRRLASIVTKDQHEKAKAKAAELAQKAKDAAAKAALAAKKKAVAGKVAAAKAASDSTKKLVGVSAQKKIEKKEAQESAKKSALQKTKAEKQKLAQQAGELETLIQHQAAAITENLQNIEADLKTTRTTLNEKKAKAEAARAEQMKELQRMVKKRDADFEKLDALKVKLQKAEDKQEVVKAKKLAIAQKAERAYLRQSDMLNDTHEKMLKIAEVWELAEKLAKKKEQEHAAKRKEETTIKQYSKKEAHQLTKTAMANAKLADRLDAAKGLSKAEHERGHDIKAQLKFLAGKAKAASEGLKKWVQKERARNPSKKIQNMTGKFLTKSAQLLKSVHAVLIQGATLKNARIQEAKHVATEVAKKTTSTVKVIKHQIELMQGLTGAKIKITKQVGSEKDKLDAKIAAEKARLKAHFKAIEKLRENAFSPIRKTKTIFLSDEDTVASLQQQYNAAQEALHAQFANHVMLNALKGHVDEGQQLVESLGNLQGDILHRARLSEKNLSLVNSAKMSTQDKNAVKTLAAVSKVVSAQNAGLRKAATAMQGAAHAAAKLGQSAPKSR